MMRSASFLAFWLAVFLLATAVTAHAQVAVYRLTFTQTGDSINYRPYQNGYYVAPIEGGAGSLILTLVTGNTREYFTYETFGEVFVAIKGNTKKMVLSATATNDVSTTVFYGIGTTDDEIEVESRNAVSKVKVATRLTGYAVSADSEQDLPFTGTGTSLGVAGVSVLTARLEDAFTEIAIRDNVDVAGEVDILVAELTADGYVDGKADDTTTTTPTTPTTPTEPTTPTTDTTGTTSTTGTTTGTTGTTTGTTGTTTGTTGTTTGTTGTTTTTGTTNTTTTDTSAATGTTTTTQ